MHFKHGSAWDLSVEAVAVSASLSFSSLSTMLAGILSAEWYAREHNIEKRKPLKRSNHSLEKLPT